MKILLFFLLLFSLGCQSEKNQKEQIIHRQKAIDVEIDRIFFVMDSLSDESRFGNTNHSAEKIRYGKKAIQLSREYDSLSVVMKNL